MLDAPADKSLEKRRHLSNLFYSHRAHGVEDIFRTRSGTDEKMVSDEPDQLPEIEKGSLASQRVAHAGKSKIAGMGYASYFRAGEQSKGVAAGPRPGLLAAASAKINFYRATRTEGGRQLPHKA
jgi:hypothetical protein